MSQYTRLADSLLHSFQGSDDSPNPSPAGPPTATPVPAGPPVYDAAGPSPRQTSSRMRSSIACIRCRRSKVKCVNAGVGTPCRSCENSGRECTYPPPVATGTRRRDSLSGKPEGFGDGERRQRPRKSTHTFVANPVSGMSPRPSTDALDSSLLIPTVWQELFEIFQIHYSADLPFLHPPTFLKPLHKAKLQSQATLSTSNDAHTNPRPPVSAEFLLAFLALTARFHPKLVAHHSPPTSTRASNPLIASEYYAAAASERLTTSWSESSLQDIDRIQALLMLGLHEWGMCRGAKAWLTIGSAIRQAQAMGLQYELDLDDEPLSRSMALNCEAERMGVGNRKSSYSDDKEDGDAFIQQEIRRRTFWSCFIMDRYLSSGKYRPQMLQAKELRIQLPASERSFLFAEKVRTLMLGEEENGDVRRAEMQQSRHVSVKIGTNGASGSASPNGAVEEERTRLETGADEGLISRYIKILEIYGKVIKWSCAGGRRTEEYPPWDHRGEFQQLRKLCLDWKSGLPRQHTLTPQNTQAHISLKTSTPYTLIHTVYLLCQIALHREYVPFIPIRCEKPEGPLDPPLFPADKYDVPEGFWEERARECFKAARDIMDLIRSCQEWNALVETPITGFSIYTVAFIGVYCINFPQMDPHGSMCTPRDQKSHADGSKIQGESKGFEAARKALEMLGQMTTKLHMANGWFKTINRMHKYFRRMKSDYKKNVAALDSTTSESDSPVSTRHLSLREGGVGGGLDEWKLLERTLKEFGSLEDQDQEMVDVGHRPNSRALDGVYDDSGSGTTVKSEEGDRGQPPSSDPTRPDSGVWNAINAVPGAATSNGQPASSTAASNGQFRTYESYPQQTQQAQEAPAPQQQPTYALQINNFRPAYSHESASAAPPSLTSPGSHSATTPSNPSPPFDRQQQAYGAWTSQNAAFPRQPQQQPYSNGMSMAPQAQTQQMQATASYPTPQQSMPPPGAMQEVHQPWNQMQKEAWLNSLDTRLGGDDIAAFVDGGEFADWATMSANRGYGGTWLSTVWGDGNSGV